ncbi:MAG: nucleotide pyrophosphohydrolase [Verrucomicrobia bacterium]|nr:nucleotide pyrophosphohydrolase [Verrucomicrobiota bacterium]
MSRLRSPCGCPWDLDQTHESLIRCLRDETAEVIESIRKKDFHGMREELGDLLLNIVFHSQMAREAGKFNFDDVVRTLNRKLIRRHPHVFRCRSARRNDGPVNGKRATNTAAVLKQWNEIKAREKKDRRHVRNRPPSISV